MKCPKCNVALVMADRQGVEIDYCPECRGVWLDRGELDKIIERSASYTKLQDTGNSYNTHKSEPRHYDDSYKGHYNDPHYKHKKKKGFLSDFFDFD